MTLTVNDRARHIATFRYLEVHLMETAARWTPLTPEMEVKVLLGRHIWDFAQHADWLGKRTFELRQPEQFTLTPVPAFVELLQKISASGDTSSRLSNLYDVLMPEVAGRYGDYLEATDRLLDEPSVRIIERIVADYTRQRAEAAEVRERLGIASAPAAAMIAAMREHQTIVQRRND
ncbi:MAG TPA: hypothetical protein VNL91_08935 [Thermoanaerobaculia bacterium]|nr:hypothetical protein [Thermoanaerobaculia bacterium]